METSVPREVGRSSTKGVVLRLPDGAGRSSVPNDAQWRQLYHTSIVRGLSKAHLRKRIPEVELHSGEHSIGEFGTRHPKQVLTDILFNRPGSTRSFDSTRPQTRVDGTCPATMMVLRSSLGSLKERPQTCDQILAVSAGGFGRPSTECSPQAGRGSRFKQGELPLHKEGDKDEEAADFAESEGTESESEGSEVASLAESTELGGQLEVHIQQQLFEGSSGKLPSWYLRRGGEEHTGIVDGNFRRNRADRSKRRSAVVVSWRGYLVRAIDGILKALSIDPWRGRVPDFIVWWLLSLVCRGGSSSVFEAASGAELEVSYIVDAILIPRVIGGDPDVARMVGKAAGLIAREIRRSMEAAEILEGVLSPREDDDSLAESSLVQPLPEGPGWPTISHADWVEEVEKWRAVSRSKLTCPDFRTTVERSLQIALLHGVYSCLHPAVKDWAGSLRAELVGVFARFADWPARNGGRHMTLRGLKNLLASMALYPRELPEFVVSLLWRHAKCVEELQDEQDTSWSFPASLKRSGSGKKRGKKRAGDPYKWLNDCLSGGDTTESPPIDAALKILSGLENFVRAHDCTVDEIFVPFSDDAATVKVGMFLFVCGTYCDIVGLPGIEPATLAKAFTMIDPEFNIGSATIRLVALDVSLRRFCHHKMRLGGPKVPNFRTANEGWNPRVVFGPTAMVECLVRLAAFRMRVLGNVMQQKHATARDYCAWLEMVLRNNDIIHDVTAPGIEPGSLDTAFSAIADLVALSKDSSGADKDFTSSSHECDA
ncbi:hypothetical protein FOZ61_009631 [Perkinsus olseni]|uniref:Uncharacterized protein n=1 Tax=Perkinsus olseni TaxID=32597 RepID=A0A7J6KZZ4_PEROL|nr:hypothetical protein FOZ61_009631 [Perkinsus olseni]KAF4654787.1 hypothetical protein FOL46_008543 [Perkinsus olseni]